jgi:transposase InsO family protein
MWVALLATKDEALEAIRHIQAAAERKSDKQLRALCTNRGGGWRVHRSALPRVLPELGVRWELMAPYTPQQNGVIERQNQTVVGTAQSMLKAKNLPGIFWGEVVTVAVYTLNHTTMKDNGGKTPYEL